MTCVGRSGCPCVYTRWVFRGGHVADSAVVPDPSSGESNSSFSLGNHLSLKCRCFDEFLFPNRGGWYYPAAELGCVGQASAMTSEQVPDHVVVSEVSTCPASGRQSPHRGVSAPGKGPLCPARRGRCEPAGARGHAACHPGQRGPQLRQLRLLST